MGAGGWRGWRNCIECGANFVDTPFPESERDSDMINSCFSARTQKKRMVPLFSATVAPLAAEVPFLCLVFSITDDAFTGFEGCFLPGGIAAGDRNPMDLASHTPISSIC